MGRVYLVYRGDSVELPFGETLVGRDAGCMLRFNDPAVSRYHVRIVRRRDEVFVEDMGSTNGTLVNGASATKPVAVRHGDIISVGSRELKVTTVATPEREPPTLNLEAVSAPAGMQGQRKTTTKMPVTPDPDRLTHQRCPRCGGPVTSEDDSCPACHYDWGSFRMRAPTLPTTIAPSRRASRRTVELSVVYVSAELEVEAMTRDLSVIGVFICSQVLDPVGTTCQLTFLADGRASMRVAGVVRRVVAHQAPGEMPVGIGVEFVAIDAEQRSWLETVVARTGAGAARVG